MGAEFVAEETKNADPASGNAIVYSDGKLEEPIQGSQENVFTFTNESNESIVAAIGMQGKPVYASEALPDQVVAFDMSDSNVYVTVVTSEIQAGEVIDVAEFGVVGDLNTFGDVGSLRVTLTEDEGEFVFSIEE